MSGHDLYEQRKNLYLTPSANTKGAMYLGLVLGLVGLIYGGVSGQGTRVWGAYLFNLFFFFNLALGGLVFCGIQDVVGAQWARPIRRVFEGFSAFLPVAAVLFVVFLVAVMTNVGDAGSVYKWIKDPAMLEPFWGKKTWLQPTFMLVRDLVALAIILILATVQWRWSLRRDMLMVEGHKEEAQRLGALVKEKSRFWSAPILVAYAVTFTLLGFDLLMSLAPTWLSTLWGGWLFAVMMQSLMAATLLVMFGLQGTVVGSYISRAQFHDVGKLMHGFTVFFAYLTYAHILTYWYGNMPEETEYFLHRLHGPWLYIVSIVPFFVFIIPLYTLIFKAAKWTPAVTIPICVMILVSQWFIALLIVTPEVVQAGQWQFPWLEFLVFGGFVGLFMMSYYWFAKRYPMLPIADPLLKDALEGGHH